MAVLTIKCKNCPMRYLGGKSKLARRIVDNLPLEWADEVWEPFMGGGAVTVELARRMRKGQRLVSSDSFVPLMTMWKAVLDGWVPPQYVSQDEHRAAKSLQDTDPLKAFIGFGCSFGACYFDTYARDPSGRRVLSNESYRNVLRCAKSFRSSLADLSFRFGSFFDTHPSPSNSNRLIYCDPPYAGTRGYPTGAFDHERFWAYCREWRRHGARVYVSEFTAPGFAVPVWSNERKITASCGRQKRRSVTEYLFEVLP